VGENLIEQPNHVIAFNGSGLDSSGSAYHSFLTIADLYGADKFDEIAAATKAKIPTWAKAAVDASGELSLSQSIVEQHLHTQHDLLFKKNVSAVEVLTVVAPRGLFASNFWILFPFARGSVHLGDVSKIIDPLIDPRYFLADFDFNSTVAAGRVAQRFWLTSPIKHYVASPMAPGAELLPNDATDEQWRAFILQNCRSSHAMSITKANRVRKSGFEHASARDGVGDVARARRRR